MPNLSFCKMMMASARVMIKRAILSLSTIPKTSTGVFQVVGITMVTSLAAAITAAATDFIDPMQDFNPPSSLFDSSSSSIYNFFPWMKPLSAFLFPSLVEEIFWRGMLIPHPSTIAHIPSSGRCLSTAAGIRLMLPPQAGMVLALHVMSHPLAGLTVWPRGRQVFCDPRFLLLATIVLGGATASYMVSGGSVWAAMFTHGVPVALWRDFFGGEAKLLQSGGEIIEEK
jgi:predicted Abi (CAAX) family protease